MGMSRQEDLSVEAVKIARRLQSLTPGRMYLFAFVKLFGRYLWAILTPQGVKVEKADRKTKDPS